jgi:hypothetical protein
MIPTISNPVGVRFVATLSSDRGGWEIERYCPGETDKPARADKYFDNLPDRLDSPVIPAAFLNHPSPMAVFERHLNGRIEAVGVKLVSWSTDPVLFVKTLTTRTLATDVAAVHPELARVYRLSRYEWDTPEFRDLCNTLGFDWDHARPLFQPRFEELAETLMRWSSTEADVRAAWDSPQGEARIAIYELLGMMRVDANPSRDQLEKLRRPWGKADSRVVPRSADVNALIQSEELLGAAWRIH